MNYTTWLRRLFFTVLVFGVSLFAAATLAFAQQDQSPDKIWRILDKKDIKLEGTQISGLKTKPQVPEKALFVQLDQTRLGRALNRSAARISSVSGTSGFIEISLPLPDGTFARFAVQEAPMVEPGVVASDPVKSYRGQGIDDPSMTLRFNQTDEGISAMVIAPGRTYYIDPYPLRRSDKSTHVTFFRKDYDAAAKEFHCLVGEDAEGPAALGSRAERATALTNGETLRTYRLALAATGEYTQFHGGKERARVAMLNTLARVNAIYEHELAITMILVARHRDLIYDDPATDPYTNSDGNVMLVENQNNIDRVIGTANYDIGHVFGVGAGGVARIRSVGQAGIKARGVTGSSRPIGDPFDVDYVSHEMGHQFGANHTFNGSTGSCGFGNRNSTTAYEPGSGSTIMAYAGICGTDDLQPNSDDFFHVASLEEIISYVTSSGVGSVPLITPTNNHPPSVSGGSSFTIPRGTPFILTASGADPDNDRLTYSWEQYDLGEQGPPDDDVAAIRPIFRAFSPSTNPTRVFPQMEKLLAGGATPGEFLPARSRTMTFRVTARDNRGGFSYGVTSVTVNNDAGPLSVTSPTSSTTWKVGSNQNVTWDVAGTSLAPINTAQARISISIDGGKTFTILAASVPNTGSATITVPNTPTAAARLKVEAVGNIYFCISPGVFKIVN